MSAQINKIRQRSILNKMAIKALALPGINLTENETVSDQQCENKETGRTCCRYQIFLR